jgi:NAD(P)-dependent dehydrogenase (short-subunit alcohol dehydrogenase family)
MRAIVTGSSRGLGEAYAHALAAHGAQVVVNGTDAERVGRVVEAISAAGHDAAPHVGSIASFDGAEALVGTCVDRFGGVDIVVNNAGVVAERMMFNMTEEEFRGPLEIDCFGTFAVSRFAVRDMRPRGFGRIINTGDISAQTGLLGGTNVAAAKGAIFGMTYTWASELARWGITANAVIPEAYTRLHDPLIAKSIELITARGETPPTFEELASRPPRPHEITALVVYLASAESSWITGQVFTMTKERIALWSHAAEKRSLRSGAPGSAIDVEMLREQAPVTFADLVEPVGVNEPWEQ